jgi:hypothetical protein
MENCKPTLYLVQCRVKLATTYTTLNVDATLYRQLVGNILYLIHTQPDISFVVGLVSQYMQTTHKNRKATKRVLQCIQGTTQCGIQYNTKGTPLLVNFYYH